MNNYKFRRGITDLQIDQLVQYSKIDPAVLKFTADPIRFKDKKSAAKWLTGVTPFTLSDDKVNLVGITWFHEKPLPAREFTEEINSSDFYLTFAIRLYGKARGKGLSFEFMKKSLDKFMDSRRSLPRTLIRGGNDKNGVWVETSFDNYPTIKLSEKFGFRKVSEPDEKGKIIMIRTLL